MAEQRAEREEILARRPRPMQVKLQRARAPERLAARACDLTLKRVLKQYD